MKFRNYCIIALVNIEGLREDLVMISESNVNIFAPTGDALFIATFSSLMEPQDISELFKSNGRNFFLFDMDSSVSGFNITKQDIHKTLFGFLSQYDESNLNNLTNKFLNEVQRTSTDIPLYHASSVTTTQLTLNSEIISDEDLINMTATEKENLMNSILEKGSNNLTKSDKNLLEKLSK